MALVERVQKLSEHMALYKEGVLRLFIHFF